ncbi:putative L-ribulokinase [Trypanosoma cruzi]|uniref:Putative L-ribulokinase n=1 Tax=Trypanosoma cruzi TaxID=5693 RepID=A0A2V2XHG0_TRYCR|nr:putative L-ribulokinase [Trypanosoma cruzi]
MACDTTGSTPCFVDEKGAPLALQELFSENPNAMFILWKDHTSVNEAMAINDLCRKSLVDYTMYSGGTYSSEWFWSKALHVLHHDKAVREKGYALLELCEWIPALLTGVSSYAEVVRSRCACGHKAMWNEEWGGFPPSEFFFQLDPALSVIRSRMGGDTFTAEKPVGCLSPDWSRRWDLGRMWLLLEARLIATWVLSVRDWGIHTCSSNGHLHLRCDGVVSRRHE